MKTTTYKGHAFLVPSRSLGVPTYVSIPGSAEAPRGEGGRTGTNGSPQQNWARGPRTGTRAATVTYGERHACRSGRAAQPGTRPVSTSVNGPTPGQGGRRRGGDGEGGTDSTPVTGTSRAPAGAGRNEVHGRRADERQACSSGRASQPERCPVSTSAIGPTPGPGGKRRGRAEASRTDGQPPASSPGGTDRGAATVEGVMAVCQTDDTHTPSGNSGNSASGRLPGRAETSAPHQTRVASPGAPRTARTGSPEREEGGRTGTNRKSAVPRTRPNK